MSNKNKENAKKKRPRQNPRIVENMGDNDFIYIPPKKSDK